jgi:Spy/CpxP family protein refolding chaperone
MRRIALGITFLTVMLLAVTSLVGDDKKPDTKEPEPKARGFLPKYFKQLGLSDEQKQTIYKLQAKYSAKIEEMQSKIKAMKVEEAGEIEKVLTKAQHDRLKEIREGTKDKPKDGEKDKPKDEVKDKPKDK